MRDEAARELHRRVRLGAALPLLVVYFALAALYAWQASRHPVPTIFTDEIELTQLARAIADTGEPARRGEPYDGLASLQAYFLAPAWWIDSTTTAYAAVKLMLVLAMTATIFPAYALARLVVPRWYALAAAGGATAVPALAYSPIIVEEPLAYPLSTLSLWLIARALVEPGVLRIGLAVVASAIAALARTQLSILLAVLGLGLLWLGWQSSIVRRWRASWSRWDWAGAVTLAVGIVIAGSAFVGHRSQAWEITTRLYKDRILDHASWATGALAIGIGVLPLVLGIAALARPRDEPRDPNTRAFVTTSVVALAAFVWYAGIKGAYLSTVYGTVIVERNVIYLCPVLFASAALALHRGVGRAWSIAIAAAFTAYVVLATPIQLGYPYYEAHGLAILAFANRELVWPAGTIENALLITLVEAIAVVVVLRLVGRGSRAFHAIAGFSAIAVVAWSLTTQVYAAEGERQLSRQVDQNLLKPYDWVDRATGGGPVVVLGQRITDPTGIWLTEFFNRSIEKVWSLDGTAPPPGATLTPDLGSHDGTLTPPPGTEYALTLKGVRLQAPVAEERGDIVLYRVAGRPLKLADAVTGVFEDGWIADQASYTRYDVARDGPGFAVVRLSRERWCGQDRPGRATVRIGPVGIGSDKQPTIARVTQAQTQILHACAANVFTLGTPNGPWRVEVEIQPTFSPNELDPTLSDRRQLGAVFEARFQPLFGE
ncbi:MAG TPA: hypothetical protein VI503_07150 [Gaiellaceae bacterium]|nr:hypothetical protein [Gaiellaceae bacterium]